MLDQPDLDFKNMIRDREFCDNLDRLRELRSFMLQEATLGTKAGVLSLGLLNALRYHSNGRDAGLNEWEILELRTEELFGALPAESRRRFLLGKTPPWVMRLPLYLMAVALSALVLSAVIFQLTFTNPWVDNNFGMLVFPPYLLWLVSLGAIGAIAFLGMNVLSIQTDATFDLTNGRLMILRIVLGGLFGLIFALPLGLDGFVTFMKKIISPYTQTFEPQQIALLIAPFVLGFSTPLVITILSRLVEALQALFGRSSGPQAK
jgi:hypothetical protein